MISDYLDESLPDDQRETLLSILFDMVSLELSAGMTWLEACDSVDSYISILIHNINPPNDTKLYPTDN